MYALFRTFVSYGTKCVKINLDMKKQITMLFAGILWCLSAAVASGQGQITTRREKLKDFSAKTTKVVLSGNDILDEALRESVTSHWDLSPYEFCSFQEFESLKNNQKYYFLLVVKEKLRREPTPGITMLTLVKGGPEAAGGINDMLEVVSFPLCPSDFPSGREFLLLPAFLEIIQDHTARQTDTEFRAYSGLGIYNRNINKLKRKRIHFSEDDLAPQSNRKARESMDEDILFESEEKVDSIFSANTGNTVVSYVVAPAEPAPGSVCYKMLIGSDDHELYYFKKHRISARKGKGFLSDDLRTLKHIR